MQQTHKAITTSRLFQKPLDIFPLLEVTLYLSKMYVKSFIVTTIQVIPLQTRTIPSKNKIKGKFFEFLNKATCIVIKVLSRED